MKKFFYGMVSLVFVGIFLSGCGESVITPPMETTDQVTFGNLGSDEEGSPVDAGYLEAVQMGGAQNDEVEAASGIDLPEDALVFTVLENKGTSTYGYTFYSQMADFVLKAYLDEQFSADGYSKKRDWMSFGLSVESVLFAKGDSIANVSVDDRGGHRYVNVTIQN